jgi:hypothetical protein
MDSRARSVGKLRLVEVLLVAMPVVAVVVNLHWYL